MARGRGSKARRGPGRGTNLGRGISSGATIVTNPSGVTVDAQGIGYASATEVTPTELGYLDGQAGYGVAYTATAGRKINGGIVDMVNNSKGSSQTLYVAHGMTTLSNFLTTIKLLDTGTSIGPCVYNAWEIANSSAVTVSLYDYAGATTSLADTSVSVAWLAFGA